MLSEEGITYLLKKYKQLKDSSSTKNAAASKVTYR